MGTVGLVINDTANPNKVIPGVMTLTSTFECISVKAAFSGDANENATAAIQFKQSSSGTWLDAYTPYIDRRSTVEVGGSSVSNSANVNQARGSIVGLVENTSYDVRVVWTDADGIIGASTISGTVSTLSTTVTAGGTTYYVDGDAANDSGTGGTGDPWKTITHALSVTSAGDTIKVRDCATPYTAFTISTSGTSGAYRVLENDSGHTPVIAAGAASNIIVSGDYWRISGFTLTASPDNGIKIGVGASQHHIYITSCTCANTSTAGNFGTGAVFISGESHDIFILNNSFTRTSADPGQETDGVWINGSGCYTVVIDGNTIAGNFWDAIGNGGNSSLTMMENTDYANNVFSNLQDETIELDGGGINVRCWGNSGNVVCNAALSDAGVIVGPAYVFRNMIINTQNAGVGVKGGTNSVGPVYYFHNTFITAASGANEVVGFADRLHTYKNNIFQASGNIYYFGQSLNTYDYNLAYVTTAADYAYHWNSTTTDYANLAAFQAGTGQETNGKSGDPLFINAAKEIDSTSPAYNAGVVINNFNSSDSAWPYTSTAPDMGYFEVP